MSPMQFAALLASRHSSVMASGDTMTGLKMTFTGMARASLRAAAISCECFATAFKVSGPYRCWLPVTNQTSSFLRSIFNVGESCGPLDLQATRKNASGEKDYHQKNGGPEVR